jgi:hypothetical protein
MIVPVVRLRVVRIGELVEHDALALAHHLVGEVARRLHATALRREHDLGAEGTHGLPAFDGKMLRHDEDQAIAAYRRGHRERDAGIPGGRFDQRVAGLDLAAALCAADHRDRGPVLHRACGIVALQLGQYHVVVRPVALPRQPLQPHQRRPADEVLDGRICVLIAHSFNPVVRL